MSENMTEKSDVGKRIQKRGPVYTEHRGSGIIFGDLPENECYHADGGKG